MATVIDNPWADNRRRADETSNSAMELQRLPVTASKAVLVQKVFFAYLCRKSLFKRLLSGKYRKIFAI